MNLRFKTSTVEPSAVDVRDSELSDYRNVTSYSTNLYNIEPFIMCSPGGLWLKKTNKQNQKNPFRTPRLLFKVVKADIFRHSSLGPKPYYKNNL